MKILGLDLSLTSTGIADAGQGWTRVIKPGKRTGLDRLRFLRAAILAECADVDLVVVEGPSYDSKGGFQHERGGLWWLVFDAIDQAGVSVAVASPSAVKKYASGSGAAKKEEVVLAAGRRFSWYAGKTSDEADALWLSAMGYDLGAAPVVAMPAVNRGVLAKVEWPQTVPVPAPPPAKIETAA